MAFFSMTDCVILHAGTKLSDANEVALAADVDEKDVTTFGSGGYTEVIGGLRNATANVAGYWQVATDSALYSTMGSSTATCMSFQPTGVDGSVGYFMQANQSSYATGTEVGEVLPYSINASVRNTHGLVRGTVLHPIGTARTSTGTGTARAFGSGTKMAAVLHVTSVSGTSSPTITVKIRDNSATPSDWITFTAATAVGAEYKSATGTFNAENYLVSYTITGTNPSFNFSVSFAVL